MSKLAIPKFLKALSERAPTDVVAIESISNHMRALRMRQTAQGPHVIAIDQWPVSSFPWAESTSEERTNDNPSEISFSPRIRARHAALLTHGDNALVKLLRVSDKTDFQDHKQMAGRLGIEEIEDYRMATQVIQPATARTEALVLAVAFQDIKAEAFLRLLPRSGLPAPCFIGLSELGAVNAFLNDPCAPATTAAHGFIHFDHDYSVIALFNDGVLSALRTFSFGLAAVTRRIIRVLNVDESTAMGVLSDGAFDISHMIEEETREMRGQFIISRDFMERSENCSLETLHVSGPSSLIRPFMKDSQLAKSWDEWNVADAYNLRSIAKDAGDLTGIPSSWTACVGTCIGILTQS